MVGARHQARPPHPRTPTRSQPGPGRRLRATLALPNTPCLRRGRGLPDRRRLHPLRPATCAATTAPSSSPRSASPRRRAWSASSPAPASAPMAALAAAASQERQRRAGISDCPAASELGSVSRRSRSRPLPLLRPRQGLPGRPLQRRPARASRSITPAVAGPYRPRHRRGQSSASRRSRRPPRSPQYRTRSPRSCRASRSTCARSPSRSTGPTSP